MSRYITESVTSECKTFRRHGPLSTAGGGCVCYTSCLTAVCLDLYTGDKGLWGRKILQSVAIDSANNLLMTNFPKK